jgi:lipoyl-dependent peroxiredoxin
MALAQREAKVSWAGTLGGGEGALETGGGTQPLPVDWAARSEQADGTTSPEELLAAAHAACYAMALALALTRDGTPAKRLDVVGTCDLDRTAAGPHEYEITRLALDVAADVPGVDAEAFEAVALRADAECPVSNLARGTATVELSARLT